MPTPCVPVSYLEQNAAADPARPALLDAGQVATFAELRERVHAAA